MTIYLLSISCSNLAMVVCSLWSSSLNNISVMYLQPMILAALHSMMLACKFFHSKVVWYSLTRALAHPPLTWNISVLSSWLLVLVSLSVLGCLYPEEVGRALCITWLFYLEIRLGSASIYHDSFCRIFWPILHTQKKKKTVRTILSYLLWFIPATTTVQWELFLLGINFWQFHLSSKWRRCNHWNLSCLRACTCFLPNVLVTFTGINFILQLQVNCRH